MDFSRVEDTHFPVKRYLRFGDKLLDLSTPKIMGILNVTPDSFYHPSRVASEKNVLSVAEKMLEDGADIIDVGGYSTRPGSDAITEKEELDRVIPIVTILKKEFPDIILSVDTFRAMVAEQAILKGADMINDISGWQFDPKILDVIDQYKVPYILMHAEGNVETLHNSKEYVDFFRDIVYYFSEKLQELNTRGITDIIIDPGFGFSKSLEENYSLIRNLEMLHLLEQPILVGLSRKSMIWKKLGGSPESALNGTTILNTQAILKGASILRVHDVPEAREIIKLLF
ncbi:MAG: dihydropteroate synthase [Flavobacteriia bacterium]|jgi:dihydropteroate synthase